MRFCTHLCKQDAILAYKFARMSAKGVGSNLDPAVDEGEGHKGHSKQGLADD